MTTFSVVGLDLALDSTGIARRGRAVTVTSTKLGPDASLSDWAERLEDIADRVVTQVLAWDPRLVVLEAPQLFAEKVGNWHERAGLHWMVISALLAQGVTVAHCPTARVKTFLVGRAGAKKEDCYKAARTVFNGFPFCSDDEADAMAICAIGSEWIGQGWPELSMANRKKAGTAPWKKISKPQKPKKSNRKSTKAKPRAKKHGS